MEAPTRSGRYKIFVKLKRFWIEPEIMAILELALHDEEFRKKYNIPFFKKRAELFRHILDTYIKSVERIEQQKNENPPNISPPQ